MMQKTLEMAETLEHGCSPDSTQRELSNEYQHDKIKIFFKNIYVLVIGRK